MRQENKLDKVLLYGQRATLLPSRALEAFREDGTKSENQPKRLRTARFAIFSSRPIEHALGVRWLRLLFTLIICCFFPLDLLRLADLGSAGRIAPFRHYKFTTLETRGGTAADALPGISEFGLLEYTGDLYSCRASAMQGANFTQLTEEGNGAVLLMSLREKGTRWYDSWFLVTRRELGSQALDPVKFKLEASDDLVSWVTVGSSTWEQLDLKIVMTGRAAETPLERGAVMEMDMRLSWAIVLGQGFAILVFNGSAFLLAILGNLGYHRWATSAFEWGFAVQVLLQLARALSHALSLDLVTNEAAHAFFRLGYGLVWAFALFLLYRTPPVFELSFMFAATGTLVCEYSLDVALFGQLESLESTRADKVGTLMFLLNSILVFVVRLYYMRKAVVGMQRGKAAFSEVWKTVLDEESVELARLDKLVSNIHKSTNPSKRARQLGSAAVAGILKGGGGKVTNPSQSTGGLRGMMRHLWIGGVDSEGQDFSLDGSLVTEGRAGGYLGQNVIQDAKLCKALEQEDEGWRGDGKGRGALGEPIQSIDQLHAQAFLLHDLLLDYVIKLSIAHRGKFRVQWESESGIREARGFAGWDEEVDRGCKIQVCKIKNIGRMVEKCDVAYGGDLSRVLDACRQSLFFDDVSSLTGCLRALASDPKIEIVRIKSTMGENFDGSNDVLFAGMRFVSLNVRLWSSESATLCVDSHVCEIILMLTRIKEVETSTDDYYEWRKCLRSLRNAKRITSAL
eukprot:CAMPEP_0169436396 /NCGR_PEP_ID=MMETSP1042-20121227/5566_1 /TAXON_ID=464988 /ORGANISM="Hemiselmis andersenii, Strain CCMP1180" /LENGTH=738 /DNA_ID=CAMNT_0009547087 /DNA_START=37 /DNA_END=2253 /DNA_ORIENTATION=+